MGYLDCETTWPEVKIVPFLLLLVGNWVDIPKLAPVLREPERFFGPCV
jgi:hypothetical protein